jgi:hypothetical protein
MCTTMHIDDQLLRQAKAQAATLGVTLGQLIEDALRASLMRRVSSRLCAASDTLCMMAEVPLA